MIIPSAAPFGHRLRNAAPADALFAAAARQVVRAAGWAPPVMVAVPAGSEVAPATAVSGCRAR
jgi:hypothetical protein